MNCLESLIADKHSGKSDSATKPAVHKDDSNSKSCKTWPHSDPPSTATV